MPEGAIPYVKFGGSHVRDRLRAPYKRRAICHPSIAVTIIVTLMRIELAWVGIDLQPAECSLRAARSFLLGDHLHVASAMPIPQVAPRNIR
jgi:hypothetical protein